MSAEQLVFNGIDAATGDYLLPPMTTTQLAEVVRRQTLDGPHLNELKRRHAQVTEAVLAPIEGVDPTDLAQTGWGVIFAHDADPAVREALGELLEHRRKQAGRLYKECAGPREPLPGYFPGEDKQQFLTRRGAAASGPVDPENLPYYLLIVGDPEAVPFSFQYQLDVQYSVGRIWFDTPEEYARYARSVVAAETGAVRLPRRATFFGVRNPDDRATNLSADHLVGPLAQRLSASLADWTVETVLDDQADKARLTRLLGGADTPALLFTASHGMGFPHGDPRQLSHQGALLCQDWPGPEHWGRRPIPPEHYFAADDLSDDAGLLGLVAFHFACFGAGTPRLDDFPHLKSFTRQQAIAERSFLASLPRRMLAHPRGGALAVIGHVERAWSYSFVWAGIKPQFQAFQSTLTRLMKGQPVGTSLEYFNERYAELSSDLSSDLERIRYGLVPDELALSGKWTANNDARSFVIVGDPAVRLPLGDGAPAAAERPTIAVVAAPRSTTVPARPPTPAPVTRRAVPDAEALGLFDAFTGTRERLGESLGQLADKLAAALERAIADASTLQVATYVSEDMDAVAAGRGELPASAKLRALTRIEIDGDTVVCVPAASGQIDRALWEIHADMVQRAQANRAEMLKAAAAAVGGLLGPAKGM